MTTFTKCAHCDNLWDRGGSGAFGLHLTQAHAMSDEQARKEIKRERDRRYQAEKRQRLSPSELAAQAAQSQENAEAALAAHDAKREHAPKTKKELAEAMRAQSERQAEKPADKLAARGSGTVRARLAVALGDDAVKAHRMLAAKLEHDGTRDYSCTCGNWQHTCKNRGAAYKGHDAHLEALIAAAAK